MNRSIALVFTGCLVWVGNATAELNGSMIIAEGFAAPNSYSGIMPQPFAEWCGGICFPTVSLQVLDSKKANLIGFVHAWGKEATASANGSTIQFQEFIIGEFSGGQVWSITREGGHAAGSFADPALIPPKFGNVVLVGGAEGEVIGGTGKYANASGGYSTRLKVEADGNGNFIYYDELYFRYREVKLE